MKLQADFLDFDIYPNVTSMDNLKFIYENNSKKVLIIIKEGNPTNLEFLSKILTAIKLDITADILLLELSNEQQLNFATFKKQIDSEIETIILFGIQPEQLHLQFRLPKYYKLAVNGINYLGAEALSMIANNNAKKKELWTALQTMF